MMQKLLCLFFLIFLTDTTSARRRRVPPQKLSACPQNCTCLNFDCIRDNKREITCREVEIACFKSNVIKNLGVLPANTSSLTITGEYMGHTTLDIFARFQLLNKLRLPSNTIRSLKISKEFRRLKYLNLDRNRLCFLPRRNLTLYLPFLETLRLEHNNLTFLEDISFPRRLERLYLSHNYIESPRKSSFRRLRKLEVLELANNSIQEIHPKAYRDMISLETLILDQNSIEELGPSAFTVFPQLVIASLADNRISTINPTAFKLLGVRWHGVHLINLRGNNIRILEESSIALLLRVQNYYRIDLAGNPIFCDCEMMEIRDKAIMLLRDLDKTTCASPRELVGTAIADLNIEVCCD